MCPFGMVLQFLEPQEHILEISYRQEYNTMYLVLWEQLERITSWLEMEFTDWFQFQQIL